ncbi:MAG: Sec-independent protein translocase protein TatB [Dermatophilaceae bacterium]
MFDINGYELVVLVIVAIIVLGPERLPEYAAKLGRGVRQVRAMAESARASLKDQLGPEFDEVDWRQYDPRQYDPRRIVREALREPEPTTGEAASSGPEAAASDPTSRSAAGPVGTRGDPPRPTPWDTDAT